MPQTTATARRFPEVLLEVGNDGDTPRYGPMYQARELQVRAPRPAKFTASPEEQTVCLTLALICLLTCMVSTTSVTSFTVMPAPAKSVHTMSTLPEALSRTDFFGTFLACMPARPKWSRNVIKLPQRDPN